MSIDDFLGKLDGVTSDGKGGWMAAIGGLVWISAFFSDYECKQIFKALAEVLWPR